MCRHRSEKLLRAVDHASQGKGELPKDPNNLQLPALCARKDSCKKNVPMQTNTERLYLEELLQEEVKSI